MYKARLNIKKPFAVAKCREGEVVVQNGLAITPADMENMVKSGIPVSAQSSNLLKVQDFGDDDWIVPIGFRRGEDPLADGYQHACDVHSRLRDSIKEQDIETDVESSNTED